jgi:hypothetical protein
VTGQNDKLLALIDAELRRSAPQPVAALAAQLAERGGGGTAAVLFYGSALRTEALDGVLDYYVLLDRVSAWQPASFIASCANRVLPPNVGYLATTIAGEPVRAKYAVMSIAQFRARMSMRSRDTTLWARFSQPCICVWARSDADRIAATGAVCDAVITASAWSAHLGPTSASAAEFWRALFASTYGAELRVERAQRGVDIVDRDRERYENCLPLAWRAAHIEYTAHGGRLAPLLTTAQRATASRRWSRRQRLGKPLNLARLLKACFTFDGAMDYVAWKVERHSGVHIEVTAWQRRFPLLAAPRLYWHLLRRGVLR